MRRPAGGLCLAACTCAALMLGAVTVSAQGPPPPPGRPLAVAGPSAQQTSATGTGLILGQVVDGNDGSTIPGAIVMMTGSASPPAPVQSGAQAPSTFVASRRLFADSSGRFVFADLPAGSYMLSAAAPGYQSGVSGQSAPGGMSRPIALTADQKLGSVKLALWRYASVSGTVTDESGDPMVNTMVRIFRRVSSGGGLRFNAQGSARTDDQGNFRIAALSPGDYVVGVPSGTTTSPVSVLQKLNSGTSSGDGGAARQALNERIGSSGVAPPSTAGVKIGDAYVNGSPWLGWPQGVVIAKDDSHVMVQETVYFPGTTAIGTAALITLSSGQDRTNVGLQTRAVPAFKVSGALMAAPGLTAHLGVRLVQADLTNLLINDSGLEVATTISEEDGQFTFAAVPPGSYQVRVSRMPGPSRTGAPPNVAVQPSSEPALFGTAPVTVTNEPVTGVAVTLRIGPRVAGRIAFDGSAPPPSGATQQQQPRVTLTPADGRPVSVPQAVPGANGQFTVGSIPPGRYFVSAFAPGWTLRSAMVNGRDVSDLPLDLDANDVSGLVVTFFDRPAQVSGTVRTPRGDVDAASVVLLIPANYQSTLRDGAGARRFRTAATSADGKFTIGGLLPGDYLMVAIDERVYSPGADYVPLIAAAAPLSVHVTIGESAKQTQDLTTTPVTVR